MTAFDALIEKAKNAAKERANQDVEDCVNLCSEYGHEATQELILALLPKLQDQRIALLVALS